MSWPGLASAQSIDGGAEAFRRQEEREALERRREERASDVFLRRDRPVVGSEALPEETPCFTVRSIELQGAEAFSWMQRRLAPYLGACVGRQGINVIVRDLANELLARGYVTSRVAIPEQDLGDGTLELVVIPGIVREIRFADGSEAANWATAFPIRSGDLLDLRALEQGVEQMKRLPSQDVEIEIVPGAAPGESDVVIRRRQSRRLRATLGVDDSGAKATGRYLGSATLAIDGPLGLNDLAYVSATGALDRDGGKGNEGLSAFYSIPWGWWTFSAAASDFEFRQTIQGIAQAFVSSGETQTVDVRAARMLFRTGASKTSAQVRVNTRHSESYIDDVEIETQKRRLTAAEIALNHRQLLGGGALLDATIAYRAGVSWFNAEPQLEQSNPDTPNARYSLWAIDAAFVQPFKAGPLDLRYTANYRAQLTNDPLFALDFFSIGNRFTVRGFDGERTLAADGGWFLRNELAAPLPIPGQEAFFGLDTGRVSGPSTRFLAGSSLTGAVVGVRGGWKGLLYEFFAGWALSRPDNFPSNRPALGFQLLYQL